MNNRITKSYFTLILCIIALFCATDYARANNAPPAAPPSGEVVTAPAQAPAAPGAPAATAPLVVQRREEEDGKAPGLAARVKAFLNRDGSATMQAQLQQIIEEKATLQEQLTAARDELARHAAERAEIEQALTEQRNLVKATATTIAATMGVPLESLPVPSEKVPSRACDQWLAATGTEKASLYRANKAEIRAEAARRGATV